MNIGFIGAGNMASAIIKGIVKNGYNPAETYVHDLDNSKVLLLKQECAINICTDNETLIKNVDMVILAVKPYLIEKVLSPLQALLSDKKPVLVSIAAGITTEMIKGFSGVFDIPIIRVMPNVNVMVSKGMSALCKNEFASDESFAFVNNLFSKVGGVTILDENFFSIFAALAGSSPAFSYLFIESLAKAAHKAGMPKEQAVSIAAQAVLGSAAMLLASNKNPWQLIDTVCSPGGTTIEGICTLEEYGFQTAIVKCLDACMAKDKLIMENNQ